MLKSKEEYERNEEREEEKEPTKEPQATNKQNSENMEIFPL